MLTREIKYVTSFFISTIDWKNGILPKWQFENKRIEKDIVGKKYIVLVFKIKSFWGKQGPILLTKGVIQP